jgi:hypothetical protein
LLKKRLLTQRVVYFTPHFAVGIRHAVNDENTETPRDAWVEESPTTLSGFLAITLSMYNT